MQNIWSVVDLLRQNPNWRSPVISSVCGVNLDSRMLDKILYVIGKSDMPLQLLQSVISPFLKIGTLINSLLTIQVSNLMSLFHCLGCTKVAVQVRGTCSCFVAKPVFTVRSCHHFAQPQSWRTTPYWPTMAAYSIYLQLPSILKAISPSTTWGRVMPWWQGTNFHGIRQPYLLNFTILTHPSQAIVIIMKRPITSAEALLKCL